ncbi:Uncharacterised protein [Corynebacterium matruchotii]|uniref:Uncharacterized protein n=1 Tax=Corynebacterium matruchotii TaxID=43768 RepID=A0A8B4H7Z8_9CORY|nr:Uncharacterised protein [Corynebacterium matruchotii]
MSARVAAGYAKFLSQSVSVVPIIQYSPHGITNNTDFSVTKHNAASASKQSRGTTICTPFDARTVNGPVTPASLWISSVHTPVALINTSADSVVSEPVSVSNSLAPTTRLPTFVNPTTCVDGRTTAPNSAAVRNTVNVWRASSTSVSKYRTPPTTTSSFNPGANRNVPARDKCFCMGTDFAPPIKSYSANPDAIYGRSHTLCVNGKINRNGFTKCGANVDIESSRSRNDSATSRKSSIAKYRNPP